MQLVKPLVESSDGAKNSFVDPKTLSKEDKQLVTKINVGHEAEAQLLSKMHSVVDEHDSYTSTEIDINSEKGSYLRLAVVDGVVTTDGEVTGKAVVTESVNGYLTEMMTKINENLQNQLEDAHADDSEEVTS